MAEKKIVISEEVTVKAFASLLEVDPITLMKGLMRNGVMITVNQLINFDIAQLIGKQYGYDVQTRYRTNAFPECCKNKTTEKEMRRVF